MCPPCFIVNTKDLLGSLSQLMLRQRDFYLLAAATAVIAVIISATAANKDYKNDYP